MLELMEPVLLTYATRRSMQWTVGLGGTFYLLMTIAQAMSRRSPNDAYRGEGSSLAFMAMAIAYLLASQAKWQFVDPRARLLPRFARPHLAVLLGLLFIGLFLMPLLTAIVARLSITGCLACMIALASSFLWAWQSNSGVWTLVGMALYFGMMSEKVRAFWLLPASVEQYFPLHVAVLLAGWGAIVAWLARLARMTEEDDDYNIPIQAQSGSATRMERTQANRNLLRNKLSNGLWNGGPSDWWHDKLIGYQARSTSDRQRLFRYGFAPAPFEFSMFWMAAVMVAMALLLRWQESNTAIPGGFNIGSLAPLVFIPAIMPGQFLAMRRARMAQELLLPLSRAQFVDGILLEMARVTIVSLTALAVVGLGLVWLFPFDYPDTPKVLAAIAVVLAVQPYFFGANVYAALWTSAVARLGVMMLGVFPPMLACVGAISLLKYHGPTWPLVIAAMVLPLGLAVVAKARRKWLNAELAT
jgi:hypothetical protein